MPRVDANAFNADTFMARSSTSLSSLGDAGGIGSVPSTNTAPGTSTCPSTSAYRGSSPILSGMGGITSSGVMGVGGDANPALANTSRIWGFSGGSSDGKRLFLSTGTSIDSLW